MRPSKDEDASGLSLPAELSSLEPLQQFVRDGLGSARLSPNVALKTDLVLEEVLLNIFRNAYPPDQVGDVTVECGKGDTEGLFWVRFTDRGRPFDPLSMPSPDVSLGIEERSPGGLGIHLVKKMSRSQDYRREGGQNILEVLFAE